MSSLRFEETMSGRFAPWSRDPLQAYDHEGAFSASLRAGIDIADLDLFTDGDLSHTAVLSVELDIPVLSARPFVTYEGLFELFRRSDIPSDGRGYTMVYEGFVSDGERVFELRGRKYLKPGRVLRVWSETTSMRIGLRDVTHGGRVDVSAGVQEVVVQGLAPVGIPVDEPRWQRDFARPRFLSGTVRLTPGALVKQLGSMNATDAPWYRMPFVVIRFVWFFASSLVLIYVFGRSR